MAESPSTISQGKVGAVEQGGGVGCERTRNPWLADLQQKQKLCG